MAKNNKVRASAIRNYYMKISVVIVITILILICIIYTVIKNNPKLDENNTKTFETVMCNIRTEQWGRGNTRIKYWQIFFGPNEEYFIIPESNFLYESTLNMCRELENQPVTIIVLYPKAENLDKYRVISLKSGGIDYIPFTFEEANKSRFRGGLSMCVTLSLIVIGFAILIIISIEHPYYGEKLEKKYLKRLMKRKQKNNFKNMS